MIYIDDSYKKLYNTIYYTMKREEGLCSIAVIPTNHRRETWLLVPRQPSSLSSLFLGDNTHRYSPLFWGVALDRANVSYETYLTNKINYITNIKEIKNINIEK